MIVIIVSLIEWVLRLNNTLNDKIIESIYLAFNYKLSNIQYFQSALTHKSTSNDNYERLEILGDSVLQLLITEILYSKFPYYTEGEITVSRQNLVNSKSLEDIFKSLKLTDIFSKINPKFDEGYIYSDLFESIIGALYLDGGFRNARKFIETTWGPYFNIEEKNMQDSKTKLQELSQQKLKKLPDYNLIKKEGPSHSPIFTISLKVLNLKKIISSGSTIREAEKNAASIALKLINEN